MKARVRLFVPSSKYSTNFIDVDLEAECTVNTLLEKLDISPVQISLVIINGEQQRKNTIVNDGDEVILFSPITGG
ncbi:MAG: MoaD/ThiS family protein [Firmicutes bacterium]|nr:MoaD/ThiS family protein [Bacillota bacterium]